MASFSNNHPAINVDAQKAIGNIINDDNQRKSKILQICTQINDELQKDTSLYDVMKIEFGDRILDIHQLRKEINDTECPIVVAGEVSAGKSSLINLLIGRSILPVRQLASTSTICRLHNSEKRKIVLTDYDDKPTPKLFSDKDEEMESFLEEHVGRRSNPNRYKYVDIYLPIPMLQQHAIIVDTPGVGKNKTGRLFEYLPNAIAFIYVINASNAGGVQNDDWLQQIIEHLAEQQKKGNLHDFNPETTMFVCNKWDQVRPKERDEVFQFIVEKLKSDWPKFDESFQIFKLSAAQEIEQIEQSLAPSDNYDNFISGISRMVPCTLEAKVYRHARWQMFFIEKMTDRIREKISASEKTKAEKDKRRIEAEERLKRLDKKQLDKIKESAIKGIKSKCEEISEKIDCHLKSLKPEHFKWDFNTLPDDEKDFLVIRQKAKDFILEKVKHEINDWRQKNKDLVDEEIEKVLMKEFEIIEEELKAVTQYARPLTSDKSKSLLQIFLSYTSRYPGIGNIVPFVASPFAYFGLPGITFSFFVGFSSWLLYTFGYNKGNLENYRANKRQCIMQWTEDVLQNGIDKKKMNELMKPFLAHQEDFINEICNNTVPQIIKAEQKFIRDTMNDDRSVLDMSDTYVPILRKCQILLGKLDIIFLEYFKKSEFASLYVRNVVIKSVIANGKSSIVQSAKFQLGNGETTHGAVKTFKMPLKEFENFPQLSEIYSLRKVQGHPNIMELIGLSFRKDQEQKSLQICMQLCKESLHSIVYEKRSPIPCGSIQHFTDCKDSWEFISEIVRGICSGLQHIHWHGFVHCDLTIENIMVNTSGQVKLTKIGYTKQGIKNLSAEVTRREVNMAPEVFSGDLTSREADVYSVGMIIYELWYYRPGFSQPLPKDPTKYEFSINTVEELRALVLEKNDQNRGRPDLKADFSPHKDVKTILKKCWDADKASRPSLQTLLNFCTDFHIDFESTQ